MSALRDDDLALVQRVVHEASGVVIEADKRYLVETRLESLLRRKGMHSAAELLDRIRNEALTPLRRELVEAMVNGETLFFRDIVMFEMLRKDLIPRLIAAREARRSLVIWSAACSTGQEPYSVLMLLEEHFPMLRDWDVQVYATDVSHEHLERARAGRYSQYEINRGLPATQLVRCFTQEGSEWVVHQALRERIHFLPINLTTDAPPAAPVDLVLLRNVMIYWEMETKRGLLRRLKRALAPDGALVLGAAETTLSIDDDYERVSVGATSYYRVPARASQRPLG